MDIILLVAFSYQLHRMADNKGVSPWPYVLNFTGIFVAVVFAVTVVMSTVMNIDLSDMKNPENLKKLIWVQPFVLLFEVMLFLFFRQRIKRIPDYNEEEDDYPGPDNRPEPPKEKKDLSYFR